MPLNKIQIADKRFTEKSISNFAYDPETICPLCKANISPCAVSSIAFDMPNDFYSYVVILNYCTGCHNPFISKYKIGMQLNMSSGSFESAGLICSEPTRFKKQDFDAKVVSLSPQFAKIYNQALAAESSGLDEIAGLGYRKSLEFLIKDFAIHEAPDNEEKIKNMQLNQCITNYIANDNIKTLAQRSAWIGNDEAHYIRKQEDRDVSDMKAFIQATVYFIGMILITEDAASMTPK